MGDVIGRAVSRKTALETLEQTEKILPKEMITAYQAALNRVRYEFQRHEPVAPDEDYCGACGAVIFPDDNYCSNCGREILNE